MPPLMSAAVRFSAARLLDQLVEPGGDALEAEQLHLAQHRHDQPLVAERGADADIDVVVELEPVAHASGC